MTDALAIRRLDELGIAYRAVHFAPELSPEEAAQTIGLPVFALCKTLAIASMPAVVLAVLPGTAELDLGALRQHLGENRTMPVNEQALERMTGFRPGLVTPLPRAGQREFRAVIERSLMSLAELAIPGGEAGLAIVLTPRDLQVVTDGEVAAIGDPADPSGGR